MLYSLRARLVVTFLVLIIIPYVTMVVLFSKFFKSEISTSIEKSTSQTIDQYASFVDTLSVQLQDVASQVLGNDISQRWVTMQMNKAAPETMVMMDDQMRTFLSSIALNHTAVSSITVFGQNGKAVGIRDQIFLDPAFFQSDWYKAFISENRRWISSHLDPYQPSYMQEQSVNSFLFPMAELPTLTNYGVIKVNVPTTIIQDPLDKIIIGRTGRVYLLDGQGNPVLRQNLSPELKEIQDNLSRFTPQDGSEGISRIRIGDMTHVLFTRKLKESDWILVGEVPESELYQKVSRLQNTMLIIGGGLLFLTILAAYGLSSGLAKPLSRLADAMRFVERGEFAAAEKLSLMPKKLRRNEANFVLEVFGRMVRRLKYLIETEYQANLRRRDAEYKALLMQINPHFLYNTLQTIAGLAAQKRNEDVIEATEALALMLRFSLKMNNEVVTLKEELTYVRYFIFILNLRFGDKVNIRIQDETDSSALTVIKFLLQPLVENAVKYGLEQNEQAEVTIITRTAEGRLELVIRDNGTGMSLNQIEALYQEILKEDQHDMLSSTGRKIGLRNVLARCSLHYGERFDFHIDSQPGQGTTIQFNLQQEAALCTT